MTPSLSNKQFVWVDEQTYMQKGRWVDGQINRQTEGQMDVNVKFHEIHAKLDNYHQLYNNTQNLGLEIQDQLIV